MVEGGSNTQEAASSALDSRLAGKADPAETKQLSTLSPLTAGSAVDDLKLWLTEIGIDSSNFEDLIRMEMEQNQAANITINYQDSKSKYSVCSLLPSSLTMAPYHSIATYRHDGQEQTPERAQQIKD